MRGCRVIVWHPESPGVKVQLWRPWWRRKTKPFASLWEMGTYWHWHLDFEPFDATVGSA